MTANTPSRSVYASTVADLSVQVEALMRHPGRSSRDMPALIAAYLHLSTVAGRAAAVVRPATGKTTRPAGIEASLPTRDRESADYDG